MTLADLQTFCAQVTQKFASIAPGQPEDQLKGPLETLLRNVGLSTRKVIVAKTESPVSEIAARPDVAVAVDGALCGHIELKAPGVGARPQRFTGRNREQWLKLQNLPNLVYTDGNEWSHFRSGEQIGRTIRLAGNVTTDDYSAAVVQDATLLSALFDDFLSWRPIVPSDPRQLAAILAPLCKLLRSEVVEALNDNASNISYLKRDWQTYLFHDADDEQFADAYAQTLSYALLLAKFDGLVVVDTTTAVSQLRGGHFLLSQVLRILTDASARAEIETGISILERVISAIDAGAFQAAGPDPWLYFYEDFLAAYDRKLRNDRGVYYTPAQVVRAQVNLVGELLRTKLGKPLSFASPGVMTLDPAVGTGAYLLGAITLALRDVTSTYGEGAGGEFATTLAANLFGFELLVGPYAVAHLRVSERIQAEGGALPSDGARIFLTDTLESPYSSTPVQLAQAVLPLSQEYLRAQNVKRTENIVVCLGNPPYDREAREADDGSDRKGRWVRFGDGGSREIPILESFLEPVRTAGLGAELKNAYNDYVYFWRWALWKVLESNSGPGVVSFITASSYLRGPGFMGMRKVMRELFDELWIIDLQGNPRGPRPTENIFAINTPVAIAIGIRYGAPCAHVPAAVHYTKLEGTRDEKLARLDSINSFQDFSWQRCHDGWLEAFQPAATSDFFGWPLLTEIFPWTHSGVQTKRTWVVAPRNGSLPKRWTALLRSPDRGEMFGETRDRKVRERYRQLGSEAYDDSIADLESDTSTPDIVRFAYRSFDRQWLLKDNRLIDFIRPPLWETYSNDQVYLVTLLSADLGPGPCATIAADVPDCNFFRGSYWTAVMPLWRDAAASQANITEGLLDHLSGAYGFRVEATDLLAYCYAILANPSYGATFFEELSMGPPRVPITQDGELFRAAVALGRELVSLHTYEARWSTNAGGVTRGVARCDVAVGSESAEMPTSFSYDASSRTLSVGVGRFSPVSEDVWKFSVSGLDVVRSWLRYRLRGGAGRQDSELNLVEEDVWSATDTVGLLELLWLIEGTIGRRGDMDDVLARVLEGAIFNGAALPGPTVLQKRAPASQESNVSVQLPGT